MELQILNNHNGVADIQEVATVATPTIEISTIETLNPDNSRFLEANTEVIELEEIRNKHIIPVFVKDNTPLISQADFITNARDNVIKDISENI